MAVTLIAGKPLQSFSDHVVLNRISLKFLCPFSDIVKNANYTSPFRK